jgi:hypothetical protein
MLELVEDSLWASHPIVPSEGGIQLDYVDERSVEQLQGNSD